MPTNRERKKVNALLDLILTNNRTKRVFDLKLSEPHSAFLFLNILKANIDRKKLEKALKENTFIFNYHIYVVFDLNKLSQTNRQQFTICSLYSTKHPHFVLLFLK